MRFVRIYDIVIVCWCALLESRKDPMQKKEKVQWHPACVAALHLEFMEDKHELEIMQEYALNELPLRIDILIIKKDCKSNIKNEIGKIFQIHNLVEYKSSDDELCFDTFLKGIAEAYLYKVCSKKTNKIQLSEILLSFIRERKPTKLLKVLQQYGFIVEEKFKGVYYVREKNLIPIQIIVSRELDIKNHRWLNSLTRRLSREHAEELVNITNQLVEANEKKYADSVWEIVTRANSKLIEQMREDEIMCKAMAEIFKPEVDAAVEAAVESAVEAAVEVAKDTAFKEGVDDKGVKIFKNMIKRGFTREDAQSLAEIRDELVEKALAECI